MASRNLADLVGTLKALFRIGTVAWKDDSTVLRARNKADSADVPVEGASFKFAGSSSGVVTVAGAAAAGTHTMTLPTADGVNGQHLTTNGLGALRYAVSGLITTYWGSGVDGATTINSNTSLTQDLHATDLTVLTGFTLTTNGWRIFCTGTLTVQSGAFIDNSGGDGGDGAAGGTGGSGGSSPTARTAGGGQSGQAGGAGGTAAGSQGTASTSLLVGVSSTGGAGGNGGSGSGGGAGAARSGGSVTNTARPFGIANHELTHNVAGTIRNVDGGACGGCGGGGGGDGTAGGGGGGAGGGGGVIVIQAKTFTNSGTVRANGGKGGNGGSPAAGNRGGGGGGGGGSGGLVFIVHGAGATFGTVTASAGGAGTKGTKSGTGTNGNDGNAGSAGKVVEIDLVAGTVSVT